MNGTRNVFQSSVLSSSLVWLARISSLAMFGLFLSFLMGEEERPVFSQEPVSVQLIFVGWAIIFLGYLIGWRYHVTGGIIVLVALLLMNLVEYYTNERLLGAAFWLWAIPAVLFISSGRRIQSTSSLI